MVAEPSRPDPTWFRCYFCNSRVELMGRPLPPDAWIKGVIEPHYMSVCMGCRTSIDNPRPDPRHYRCLGCDKNIVIDDPVEQQRWQRDPAARIREVGNTARYVDVCPGCGAARAAALDAADRSRETISRLSREPWWQMARIWELRTGFKVERDTEGHLRYTPEQAIERAVWLEMLVADSARFPAFMAWLHAQEVGEVGEVEEVDEAA